MRKKWVGLLAVLLAFSIIMEPVYAARTVSEVQQEREEREREQRATQSRYNEAQGQLGDLEEEQAGIQSEIQALDDDLVMVLASVALMEEQIATTEGEIDQAQADYDEAKAQEEAQYEAMKRRIRYLYEKGDSSYMDIFAHATSWSDMLNQATYVEKLYEYDKKMLNQYIALKEEVAVKKSALEDKKSELETEKYEMEEEEDYLQELLAEKKAASADYEMQIARVRQEAAAYKAQIKQQNAAIQQLKDEENAIIKAEEERRKAEEAKRLAEEAARNSSASGSASTSSSSGSVSASSGGSKSVPPATGSSGSDIAKYACQFVGNPYVLGGTSLTDGADCSGFIWAVYKQYGYSLPRTSTGQRSAGREVSYEEAQPGDIICYAGHVALYLGGGRIVHASTPSSGIKYGYANYRTILTVRRIVG